jgi:serine/threonine protein kinase
VIAFPCSRCGKSLSVKDEFAGKKGKCPQCGQSVLIPQQSGAAGQAGDKSQLTAQVAQAPQSGHKGPHSDTVPPWPSAEASLASGDTLAPAASAPSKELYDFLAPPQGPDELGRLGPYRVLKVLGAGGMGVVFQAEDPMLKRKVALKAMLPGLAASESARKRFIREAQTAAAIEHDHIVHIYQVGEDRGVPYMAMQFLKGESLDERLKQMGKIPVAEVVCIGREAALGLAAAHKHGLVHRDIKPANLWLEGEPGASATGGRVKILDFGLARAAQDNAHLTQSGAIIGTPTYMAPEQANAQPVDGRTDLFSLGCVLYRLCTGVLPFQGKDTLSTLMSVAMVEPAAPHTVNPGIPRKLSDLVMQLLAKEPENRPASAEKVAAMLAGVDTSEKPVAAATVRQPAPQKESFTFEIQAARPGKKAKVARRSRPPWLLPLAIAGPAVLVVVVVLLVVLTGPGGERPPGTGKDSNKNPHVVEGKKPELIDLLPRINPLKDRVKGEWQRQGADLIGRGNGAHAVIEVPYQPPEEYDYEVEFTRTEGNGDVSLALSRAGHSFQWCLAQDGVHFGFCEVDGKPAFSNRPDLAPVNGLRNVAKVEVRKGRLIGYLNGGKVSELKTDGTNLSMFPQTKLRNDCLLGLTLWAGAATFHRVEVVEVTGKGQFVPRTPAKEVPDDLVLVHLFNGQNFEGWEQIGTGRWSVGGEILRAVGDGTGWMGTTMDYDNFELTLEYRLPAKGNSGVFIHAWKEGALNGGQFLEIQLVDDRTEGTLGKVTGTAAIFGVVATKTTVETIPDQWHKLMIRSQGRRIQVSFDGQEVINTNLDEHKDAFKRFPGLARTTGRIGLQQFKTVAEFRNIWLRPLPAVEAIPMADNDRRAAEWILKQGGKMMVDNKGERWYVNNPGDLRPVPFTIITAVLGKKAVPESEWGMLSGLASLEELNLDETGLAGKGLKLIKSLPKLRSLNLSRTDIVDDDLAVLKQFPSLKDVILANTKIGDRALVHLAALPNIGHMSLHGTQVSGPGMAALAGHPDLTVLELGQTAFSDAGLEQLARGNPGVQILRIGDTAITDKGLEHLKGMKGLRVLDLAGTKITNDGLKTLQAMPRLVELVLRNTQISDDGLAYLKGRANLTHLWLINAQVSDKGLVHLQEMPSLAEVFVAATKVTEAGAKKLRAVLPKCNVVLK